MGLGCTRLSMSRSKREDRFQEKRITNEVWGDVCFADDRTGMFLWRFS